MVDNNGTWEGCSTQWNANEKLMCEVFKITNNAIYSYDMLIGVLDLGELVFVSKIEWACSRNFWGGEWSLARAYGRLVRNRSILGQVFDIASDHPLENLHQLFYVHFINSWKHLAPLLVCLDFTAIVNWHHLLTRAFICASLIYRALFLPKND